MEIQTEKKEISEKQKAFLVGLCKRQNIPLPNGYGNWTSFEASKAIEELKSRVTTPVYVKKEAYVKPVEEVVQETRVQEKPKTTYVVDNSQNATIGMCFKIVYQAWALQRKEVPAHWAEFTKDCVEAFSLFKHFKTELVKQELGGDKPLIFQDLKSDPAFAKHLKKAQSMMG